MSQRDVILLLREKGIPMTPREMQPILKKTSGTISENCRKLENKGYLKRVEEVVDTHQGAVVFTHRYELTERGRLE